MALLDILLPDRCVLCLSLVRTRQRHLCCDFCWDSLPRIANPCLHCALPLPVPGVCGGCQRMPPVNGITVAPLIHLNEAQFLLNELKFGQGFRAGITLAEAMVDAIESHYHDDSLPQLLIAMPISWRNQLHRGHNQAVTLGQHLKRRLRLPLKLPLSRRHGPPQRSKTRAERQRLRQADFTLTKNVAADHVAIVDDVMTTGATVSTVAKILVRSGVSRVDAWVATRAV